MIAAATTGYIDEDPLFGKLYYRYIDGDVYISIYAVMRNMGERAAPFLKQYAKTMQYGFEGENILYVPSNAVFSVLEKYKRDWEDGEADDIGFYVAYLFGKWVHAQREIASFKFLQEKLTGRDLENEEKRYSLNDIVDVVNMLPVSLKKPLTLSEKLAKKSSYL